ncbi:MAG: plasmid mobilization relaxosome protein MobC [Ruminococcus sp.]|nr:plasmid mobilization relaxosome protein MobC [Ruminococcus sp.]
MTAQLVRGINSPKPPVTERINMDDKIKRTRSVQVRLTEEEFDYLNYKFEISGLKSKSEFMRMMFFEGLVVKFSDDDMQFLMRQISGMTTNINQIATRVNSTEKIYAEDIEEIRQKQEEIWQQLRYLESQLQLVRQ